MTPGESPVVWSGKGPDLGRVRDGVADGVCTAAPTGMAKPSPHVTRMAARASTLPMPPL